MTAGLPPGLPTPLVELDRLASALGGPRLWMKRDDLTPYGGSKYRKALVMVEEAVAARATTVLTEGSIESQHARSIAIAARQRGIRCVLVLSPEVSEGSEDETLLDDAHGASLVVAAAEGDRETLIADTLGELTAAGEAVHLVPFSGTSPSSAVAYARAFDELRDQAGRAGIRPTSIFVSSATGGIQAGLELGKRLAGLRDVAVLGVSSGLEVETLRGRITRLARAGAARLRRAIDIAPEDVVILDRYYGDGYRRPTAASRRALGLLRDLEGVALDPVYTAKTMAALIDLVETGSFSADDDVVFWNSAGGG